MSTQQPPPVRRWFHAYVARRDCSGSLLDTTNQRTVVLYSILLQPTPYYNIMDRLGKAQHIKPPLTAAAVVHRVSRRNAAPAANLYLVWGHQKSTAGETFCQFTTGGIVLHRTQPFWGVKNDFEIQRPAPKKGQNPYVPF